MLTNVQSCAGIHVCTLGSLIAHRLFP
jgi:hypothetical protein